VALDGGVTASVDGAAGATTMLPEVPVTDEPWATVNVVDWASTRVTGAVPSPLSKLTDEGYVAGVPSDEVLGPPKVSVLTPV
jgi:hypothetical protein